MIRVTNQLTEQRTEAAKAVIASCQAHDQTFREPYLQYGRIPNMPGLFPLLSRGRIWLINGYADDEDVK